MAGSYASFLAVLAASALVGQAVFTVCGRRSWSHLAPAVGLAALISVAWATVRFPGHGTTALIVLGVFTAAACVVLFGRLDGLGSALRAGLPVAIGAVALGSLPFIVEQRFGILGTGLNPDMSQHLLAADRLASGGSERLIESGYPLGPHSLVVAVSQLGPNLVHAFDGLMLATAVATCLVALAALERLSAPRRIAAALLVGFAYLLASNYVQGAFKEGIEALFAMAFAVVLGDLARGWPQRQRSARVLRAMPLAVLAIGAVYAYSFTGLLWLGGTLAIWAGIEVGRAVRRGGSLQARRLVRLATPTAAAATGLLALAVLPEIGRMIDFAGFETFDPSGSGLGNLFNRLSPLEALGIWPSGDFRVEPGGGAVPAFAFYLGGALALVVLAYGLRWCRRAGERAVLAGFGTALALWLYGLLAGTPYQEAKALVVLSPIVMLIGVRGIAETAPDPPETRRILERRSIAYLFPGRARAAREKLVVGIVGAVFFVAAGLSSALALVNGPVGPTDYSPALAELRPKLGPGSTLVLAPPKLLDDEHGYDYLTWELRGHRVCVEAAGEQRPRGGIAQVITVTTDPVEPEVTYSIHSQDVPPGPCPLISDSARADPAGDD
ncbi:MAG: hypothetical protein ACJ75R_02825 [Solirubrobacterales bacterium]